MSKKTNNKRGKKNGNTAILVGSMAAIILALLVIVLIVLMISTEESDSGVSQVDSVGSGSQSEYSSLPESSSEAVSVGGNASFVPAEDTPASLDADYERLILVNGKNPLPANFDYTGNLTTIPSKYINGNRNQIDKDIYPYVKAMVEAAWEDGVNLYILSPYRSYSVQQTLFNNKVKAVIKGGVPADLAEDEAATVVARPGTSEHHTGLAIDFNSVEESFEDTPMFRWLQENAEDYGFILRYPKDKIDITGVIYEPWHYRFVGINAAREINRLGVTLEEYIEIKG